MAYLAIGILTHNDVDVIGRTLASLAGQTILIPTTASDLDLKQIEICVVPNGCRDATAATAERALAGFDHSLVTTTVRILPEPGKSAAWNRFVHEFAPDEATIIVLMDADIEFSSDDVIEKLLRRLLSKPAIAVTTDVPLKSFAKSRQRSLTKRLSLAASAQRLSDHAICGQLYCARAEVLRSIWMPPRLPVEDGFLAAMIQTDGFTRSPVKTTVERVRDASHYYETHKGILGFIKHESRIIVGSVINSWIFSVLWRAGADGHVGQYILLRNKEDAEWVDRLVDDARSNKRLWLIPAHFVFWRLSPLKSLSPFQAIRRAPVALGATVISFVACIKANAILQGRAPTSYW